MFDLIKKRLTLTSLILLCFHTSVNAETNQSLMISYGTGLNDDFIQSESIDGAKNYSLGLAWQIKTNFKKEWVGYEQLEIETYFSQISQQETINLFAVRPVLSFKLGPKNPWFWQFGVGLSYFNDKEFPPAQLSTDLQFATILGLGLNLDSSKRNRLTLRYNHYSNAYIKRPNPGIDTLSLDWHWQFSR